MDIERQWMISAKDIIYWQSRQLCLSVTIVIPFPPPSFDPRKYFLLPGTASSYFHCIMFLDLFLVFVASSSSPPFYSAADTIMSLSPKLSLQSSSLFILDYLYEVCALNVAITYTDFFLHSGSIYSITSWVSPA